MSGKRHDRPARFNGFAMLLHWLVAALIVGQVTLATIMTRYTPSLAEKFTLYQLHKSIGFTVLALMVVRLAWRLTHPAPPPVAGTSRFELAAANSVHIVLYMLLLGVPLLGWALVSVSMLPIPTVLYGTIHIPHLPVLGDLPPAARPRAQALVSLLHANAARLIVILALLHIAAALRHHFWLKDTVLMRMLPSLRDRTTPPVLVAIAAGCLLALSPAGMARAKQPDNWQVDRERSHIAFTVKVGETQISGEPASYKATIRLDPDAPGPAEIAISITTGSLSTTQTSVDPTMLSPDGLDSEQFPAITFSAREYRKAADGGFEMPGTLRIKGVEKPAVIAFTMTVTDGVAEVHGKTVVNRLDFGIGASFGDQLAPEVAIELTLFAKRG